MSLWVEFDMSGGKRVLYRHRRLVGLQTRLRLLDTTSILCDSVDVRDHETQSLRKILLSVGYDDVVGIWV